MARARASLPIARGLRRAQIYSVAPGCASAVSPPVGYASAALLSAPFCLLLMALLCERVERHKRCHPSPHPRVRHHLPHPPLHLPAVHLPLSRPRRPVGCRRQTPRRPTRHLWL